MKIVRLNLKKMCVVSSTRYANLVYFLVVVLLYLFFAPIVGAKTSFSCADVTEIPTIECEALVAFYNGMNGDDWFLDEREGWLQTDTPCSWHGVTCSRNNVVVELNKAHLRSGGKLPAEIGNLTQLTVLELSFSQLTTLPPEIGNLINLERLHLAGNQLTQLPIQIGNLTSLRVLNLTANPLTAVPSEIGNLTQLHELYLSSTQLTTLPSEISNLTNLISLWVGDNQFTTLPAGMVNLINLRFINYDIDMCVDAESAEVREWNDSIGTWGDAREVITPQSCDSSSIISDPSASNPDVSGIDIELDQCHPVSKGRAFMHNSIDAEICVPDAQNAVPLSVSTQRMKVTDSAPPLLSLSTVGLCLLSLGVLRHGRN